MENKYKLQKVFDCQHMPQDLREKFFDLFDWCIGNDTYVEQTIHGSKRKYTLPDGTEVDDSGGPEDCLDQWLIENGGNSGEEVLIKRWW